MRCKICFCMSGAAIMALAVTILVNTSSAAINGGNKKVAGTVDKIAAFIKKGDMKTADAEAKKLSKFLLKQEYPLEPLMENLGLRKPDGTGGRGIGKKKIANIPDSAWLFLKQIDRDAPPKILLTKHKAEFVQMAWTIRSVAEVAVHMPPKDLDKNEKKLWSKLAKQMQTSSIALVKAFENGSPAVVRNAAIKINASCDKCHEAFK